MPARAREKGILGVIALFASAGVTGALWAEPPTDDRSQLPPIITPVEPQKPVSVDDLRAAADGAIAQRAWDRADAAYRRMWLNLESREAGAEGLSRLHRMPGFRLSVDTAALEATQLLLGDGFRRGDTSHFVVLSDCDTAWTNTRAQVLERTRDQYFRVAKRMGVLVVPHERKLLCVFFKDHEMYRAFARTHDRVEAAWIAGYYSTAANRIVFFNEASAPAYEEASSQLDTYRARVRSLREQSDGARANGQAAAAERFGTQADELEERIRSAGRKLSDHAAAGSTRKTVHECIHLLSFNTGMQVRDHDYPFWLSEGLATSFETEQTGRAFGPDRDTASDRRELFDELAAASKLMPLEVLVTLDKVPEGTDVADGLYCQSYVLFRYLFSKDAKQVGRFIEALGGGQAGQRGGNDFLEAFSTHFGEPAKVQAALLGP